MRVQKFRLLPDMHLKILLNHHDLQNYKNITESFSCKIFQHQSLHQRPLPSNNAPCFPPTLQPASMADTFHLHYFPSFPNFFSYAQVYSLAVPHNFIIDHLQDLIKLR